MSGRKPIIGICGGIGAGKTAVAAECEKLGCRVISSDALNHAILRRREVAEKLAEWWGADVLSAAGEPDRARIAEIVFGEPAEKRRLETLVYPLIAAERDAIIRAVENNSAIKAIVLDSPLLFESNLDRECDWIVFVDASEPERLARVWKQRRWTADEVGRRETAQLPLAEKRRWSDFVVRNDGPPEQLHSQVANILAEILRQTTGAK